MQNYSEMLLAGDIGGTNTRLGLFEPTRPRPRLVAAQGFQTLDYADLPSMITSFLKASSVDGSHISRACFGVAGPVVHNAAALTHVPWTIEGDAIAAAFHLKDARVLNALVARAHGVPLLDEPEPPPLRAGEPIHGGNMTLIAAGTGLGIALLHTVDGRTIPSPSEGG